MSQKIGVVGAGTMGNGIAQVFAMKGFDVVLADVSDAALVKGTANINISLQRMAKKELIAEANIPGILAHIRATTKLAELAGCDVVVEAATENAEIKEKSSANWTPPSAKCVLASIPRPSPSPASPAGSATRNGWWACTS